MDRLFGGDEFTVIVAMDHGIAGSVDGLGDPLTILAKVLDARPRGVLLNAGLARHAMPGLSSIDSPCLVLALDQVIHAASRGGGPAVAHGPQVTVEEAVRLGADAVKAMLVVGGPDRTAELGNLRYLANAAERCRHWEMPLMIEPYLCGEAVPIDPIERAELAADGARKCLEVGADILKVEYPGDEALFRKAVLAAPVPVLVLGGPRRSNPQELLEDIGAAARAGAVGIAMGRNIWSQADPAKMIRAIREVVRGAEPQAVMADLVT